MTTASSSGPNEITKDSEEKGWTIYNRTSHDRE